ncbi:TPA: ead/Ea22-like family protein [Escherichia coli]|uniref:ead/Ea22-like family protein n=1 Tax=Escherichia coli TaxID=562 RepID=UPI0009380323|nr:ead/Ea22-like family protein [Escherichia coli]EKK2313000.1 ead/Ea22-like family protein [Escherichia coli O4]HBC2922295.1 ead/Ea22-like family protein [Escherichia coli O146]EEC8120420.1 ead/Ea22-like family protein [Escherichia coli]EEC9018407.1 ead/Ea22-like family protein [Escherichia coli]EEQ5617447.1 ead/Ea22-like family protein [Escherichia coli]
MSKIDYQVLRDVSERAITAMTHLSILPGDDDLLSEKKLKELGIDIDAIHAFKIMAGPETVLSLLDERDALNERMAELEANLAELAEDQQKAIESIKQADAAVKLAHEKFSALAAENAVMKKFCKDAAFDADYEAELGMERGGFSDALNDIETPATDAFLAEVRAQAFNDLCSVFVKDATVVGLDDGDIVTVKEAKDALLHCAEQLRKGGNQ